MLSVCLITGSAGLIGSESVEFFSKKFEKIIGIDNDMRARFFGQDASTTWNTNRLLNKISNFEHHSTDIRDSDGNIILMTC